jgi:hypothetical protein
MGNVQFRGERSLALRPAVGVVNGTHRKRKRFPAPFKLSRLPLHFFFFLAEPKAGEPTNQTLSPNGVAEGGGVLPSKQSGELGRRQAMSPLFLVS